MERFIAYFDILGFKKFIQNNPKDYIDHYFEHVFRESQSALADGQLVPGGPGIAVPDLTQAKVSCMHISDSILFWTKDLSEQSFLDIVAVCYGFFWRSMQASFPLRGCLVAGEMEFHPFQIRGAGNAIFHNASMYGAGIVSSYEKAEAQDWAGAYIDASALQHIDPTVIDQLVASGKVRYYDVPYTKGRPAKRQLAFPIIKPDFNPETFKNVSITLTATFTRHMAGEALIPEAQQKLDNTLGYLDFLREDPPSGKKP